LGKKRKQRFKQSVRISASEKEFNRLQKNVFKKLDRLESKHGEAFRKSVESGLSLSNFNQTKNTYQRNKLKDVMKSFTDRSNLDYRYRQNDDGVIITNTDYNRLKKLSDKGKKLSVKELRKIYTKQMLDEESRVGDRDIYTRSTLDKVGMSSFREFDFDNITTQEQLKYVEDRLLKQSIPDYYDKKKATLQENFINKISGIYNSFTGDDVVNMVRNMKEDEFWDFYTRSRIAKLENFNYRYDSETDNKQNEQLENVRQQLANYLDGVYE